MSLAKRATALVAMSALAGCGTILNNGPAVVHIPPGASIDGYAGPTVAVDPQHIHEIVYPDGRRCLIDSNVNWLYVAADIILFLWPVIVDAITGDWKVTDAGDCPGVLIE